MGHHHELEIWKLGRKLAKEAYQLSAVLPSDEKFGLKSQIQRAAVSVPANIAEGAGRGTDPSFLQFVRIAIGSLNELETLVLIAEDVEVVSSSQTAVLSASIRDLSVRLRNFSAKLSSGSGAIVSHRKATVSHRQLS